MALERITVPFEKDLALIGQIYKELKMIETADSAAIPALQDPGISGPEHRGKIAILKDIRRGEQK